MAKTFKNRALTIATVGILSGSAITIATDGLIQEAQAVVVPTIPQPVRAAAGGPLPELHISLRGEYYDLIRFALFDKSTWDYHREPIRVSDTAKPITVMVFVNDVTTFTSRIDTSVDWSILVDDLSASNFDQLSSAYDVRPITLELLDSFEYKGDGKYVFKDIFDPRVYDRSAIEHEQTPLPEPRVYDTATGPTVDLLDTTDSDFKRVNSTTFSEAESVRAFLSDDLYYNGLTRITELRDHGAIRWYMNDEFFFWKAPLRIYEEDERILLLFAQAFLEGEDDDG